MADKGWFKHSPEHSLASRGIQTKDRGEQRTETRVPTKTRTKTIRNTPTKDKEFDRLLQLFADYNLKYNLSPSIDNNGIYLTPRESIQIMREATPNGCGEFNIEKLQQLSEVFKNPQFIIARDTDGGVIVRVSGEPYSHPGSIREWIGASTVTISEDGIYSFKWEPSKTIQSKKSDVKLSRDDRQLLEWAEEVKTKQTDLSFPEWVRSGEE